MASWPRAWAGRWPLARREVKLFFLGCVVVAGIFGAATAKLWDPVHAGDAGGLLALVLVLLSGSKTEAR